MNDLTGKRFGRLVVLKYFDEVPVYKKRWLCKCDCGKEKVIRGNNLSNGHIVSCGCYHSEIGKKQLQDLKGKRFGKLTVVKYCGERTPENSRCKNHTWLCKCDCGKEKIILGASLRSGTTKSCGCYQAEIVSSRLIDLTGKKFGLLTVKKYSHKKNNQPHWDCVCDCGKTKCIAGNSLKSGRSKSCGCNISKINKTHGMWGKPGYKAIYLSDPLKKIRHNTSCLILLGLKRTNGNKKGESAFKHLPYTVQELKLHLEKLWEPWMNWNNYGGKTNKKEKTWQIDHIIPHIKFPYKDLKDPLFQECWALSNLRPLEKIDNMKKGSK